MSIRSLKLRFPVPLLSTTVLICILSMAPGNTVENSGGATSFTPAPAPATVKANAKWMSRLSDELTLAQISLPGTHDSGALHNGASFGFAKCQSWSVRDQLRAGIRFLDIRCRHLDDRFHIYHGIIDQQLTFAEVRDTCRDFLVKNPSECIVMSVKRESTPTNNSRSFAATFRALTKNDGELWHIDTETPKLSSVRGKIVLVDRVGTLGGLSWKTMRKQDHFQAPVGRKIKLIQKHLQAAKEGKRTLWFVNFCSGVVPKALVTPRRYAPRTNDAVLSYLKDQQRKPTHVGTVVMDYQGEELIT